MTPEKNLKEIIKDVSLCSNTPQYTIEHILHFVFGTIRDSMRAGELKSYRLKRTFSIVIKPGKRPYAEKTVKNNRKIKILRELHKRYGKASNTEIKSDTRGLDKSDMEG